MSFFIQFVTHLKQWFALEQAIQALVVDVAEKKAVSQEQLIAFCEATANLLESGAIGGNIDKATVEQVKGILEDIIKSSGLPSSSGPAAPSA